MAGDIGFDLLPPDGPEIDVDLELAEVLQVDDPVEVDVAEARPLGRGWAFDFETGQFIRHGDAPAIVTGLEQLKQWIHKALRTARFAHPIYGDDFGLDDVELVGRRPSPDLIGQWSDAVDDALMVHDRISAVRDFKFSFDPLDDALFASFTVEVDEGDETVLIEDMPLGVA